MAKTPATETLYSDDQLLIVSKSPGILSVPDRYDVNAPHVRLLLEPEYGDLWVVHRIDKETSGVLVLARTVEAHKILNDQFAGRTAEKTYHVLVCGSPFWDEQVADFPLKIDGDRLHRVVVDRRKGKESLTRFRVLERFISYALLEAKPETGRTHQIRKHIGELGFPAVCDPLYGDGKPLLLSSFKRKYNPPRWEDENPLMSRLALHALCVSFNHPGTGERVCFEAPLPKDFRATLNQLRKNKG